MKYLKSVKRDQIHEVEWENDICIEYLKKNAYNGNMRKKQKMIPLHPGIMVLIIVCFPTRIQNKCVFSWVPLEDTVDISKIIRIQIHMYNYGHTTYCMFMIYSWSVQWSDND